MQLYIEKDFLDNFYIEYNDEFIQRKVALIIKEYGSKNVFMDVVIDSVEDLQNLKTENKFFAYLCSNDKAPIPVNSIKEHVFSLNSDFKQTLVFMNQEQDWFAQAENRGALCFNFDNYKERIKGIIDELHFKIDLSENFTGWEFLKKFKNISFNNLVISDGYILSDKSKQKMEDNIIPILKKLVLQKNEKIDVSIFTKELNPIRPEEKYKREKAKKNHVKLNSVFANYKTKFSIILNDFSEFVLHDRNIATNFSLMDCGEGFNLIPFKASNSQIISETIFDKYTYNRLNKIRQKQNEYIEKLKRLETSKFKMYPDPY